MRSVLFFIFPLLALVQNVNAEPNDPYENVELLPYNPWGYYRNAKEIENLFEQIKPSVVIEMGSWAGASAIHMASLLPDEGKLYAIDHWLGSTKGLPGDDNFKIICPEVYQLFLSNVIQANYTHIIVPVRDKSENAAKRLSDVKADFLYIDGSHDYASVYADLQRWYPKVKGHGIMGGDDWDFPDVKKAVNQFAKDNNLTVIAPSSCFWYTIENE